MADPLFTCLVNSNAVKQKVSCTVIKDGRTCLVVMGDDSVLEVVGLNSCTVNWMEMTFFTLICC